MCVLIKEIVISFLKEKQNQLMEQYAEWEDLQGKFPEDYGLCQPEMDMAYRICEEIRRKIYESEGFCGKQEI